MKVKILIISVVVMLHSLLTVPAAFAQVPPHVPGSICFTPQFWCWVNPPGVPRSSCSCRSPYGSIGGYLN